MEDREVIQAFVRGGIRRAYGPTLHVEGDGLFLGGWWQTAFRIAPDAFVLRNEEPPEPTTAASDVATELAALGLHHVGVDHPLVDAITYTALTLGHVSWALWAPDLATGEQALMARAGADTFLDQPVLSGHHAADLGTELGGARRLAGLPASVVLAVGLAPERAEEVRAAFADCDCDCRALDDVDADACCALLPTLVLVDATSAAGRALIVDLRSTTWGATVPLVAVTDGDDVPLAVDASVDVAQPAAAWAERVGYLLP